MTVPRRILLVDDHPVVRQGLRQMLSQESGLTVCGEAGTMSQALTAMESAAPDLVVVDVALGHDDGIELVKQIVARWPHVFVLMLSMHSEKLYAERALRAGAHGYVMKDAAPMHVVAAIRRVLDGGVYVSEALQTQWLRRVVDGTPAHQSPIERLSDRELAVFRLIGSGLSTRDIADRLNLSVKTVESYRENIKDKLELGSATELVQQAALWLRETTGG